MTAEILIMNNNAIAMAADSAVTVGNKKTYNGVNKLFMLSNDPPMGIMIFGSANFGNISLETLIKEYRKKTNFKELKSISNIKNNFLSYLSKVTPRDDVHNMVEDYYLNTFKKLIEDTYSKCSEKEFYNLMKQYKNQKIFSFLEEDSYKAKYDSKFEEIIPKVNNKDFEITVDCLKKCFCHELDLSSTSVVIAGFSVEDMFPSFTSFNLICNYNDEIIYNDLESKINFSGSGIVPFAQSDVITTFLSGIDGNFELALIKYFTNFIDMYLTELHDAIDSNKKINGKDLNNIKKEINELKKTNDNRIEEFRKTINEMKESIYSPVLDSVESLPKDELANMSESLIHITSLKRKVSSDLETVGGAIDVAIISKGDGFIWKKRKHYFNPELNPHFFNK